MSDVDSQFPLPGSGLTQDERGQIAYLKTYQYAFDHPSWLTNLALIGIAAMVPIVGPIVTLGYVCQLWKALHRRPDRLYPLFDLNKLSDYLMAGLWPFLARLIAVGLLAVVISPIMLCAGVGGAAIGEETDEALGMLIIGLGAMVTFVLAIAASLVMLPFEFRAGWSQDLGTALNFEWLKDFLSRVGMELFLVVLFVAITSNIVAWIGLALCCVGVIPASGLIIMAVSHAQYQLYELYLDRGGAPIPSKDEDIFEV